MTYQPDIPQGTQTPVGTVAEIQANFSTFASIFARSSGGVNYGHGAMNMSVQGLHQVVLMENQANPPTVIGDFVALYNLNAASKAGTQPQLFLTIPKFLPNNILNTPMQLTYNTVNTSGPVYQSFLIGGYLIFFGSTTNIANPITLSPQPTTILMAQAASNTSNGSHTPFTAGILVNNPTLTIQSNATGAYRFSWIAIGTV